MGFVRKRKEGMKRMFRNEFLEIKFLLLAMGNSFSNFSLLRGQRMAAIPLLHPDLLELKTPATVSRN